MKNTKLVFAFSVLALAALACQVTGAAPQATYTPLPTYTPVPTDPPPTATPEPDFIEINEGLHPYLVQAVEQGCALTDPEPNQERRFTIRDGEIVLYNPSSGNESTYEQIGEFRFLRYNSVDRPIVVEFTEFGYVLEVYDPGDNVDQVEPCGYFTFTLQDR